MHSFEIIKYESKYKHLWNEFIKTSKNGTFLFNRDYMDYHSDRFIDHSLLFLKSQKLWAIMPANITSDTIVSHGGLTFGGIITDEKMKTPLMLEIFDLLKEYLSSIKIRNLLYKAIPHIYHNIPAEEDLYALFLNNAKLIQRDVSSSICLNKDFSYSKGRKWCINKGHKHGLTINRSYDFNSFMALEKKVLIDKYGVEPTHSSIEIELLANRFSDNIALYIIEKDNAIIAGAIIYKSRKVAHAQYIASNDEGKHIGAPDILLDYIIKECSKSFDYFDFGISTENCGRYLNIGLIQNKESFGARAIAYDTYELYIE